MKSVVLKVGGSLLSRGDNILFDFDYFYQLKRLLEEFTKQDFRFLLNVGGGFITRKYQHLASSHGENDTIDVHRIGIALTNLNAQIVHGLLGELAHPEILRYQAYDNFLSAAHPDFDFFGAKIIVAGGSEPGRSNDWNALQFAKNLGIDQVIDVKNVDAVYSADPKLDPGATKFAVLDWKQYLDVIGNPTEHAPGANYPVDPLAAKEAEQSGVEFLVVGEDLENLKQLLLGAEFVGTRISSKD